MTRSEGVREGGGIETLRGQKHPSQHRRGGSGVLKAAKNRPTTVVQDDNLHVRFRFGLSQQQGHGVVGEGEIADDNTHRPAGAQPHTCLLYTSDAADE